MELNERQLEITRLIRRLERISVHDLCLRFKTSAVTIRKDLDELEERGILLRTHGGAVLAENVEQTVKLQEKVAVHTEMKAVIAAKAHEMIFNCQTVALDSGSTTLALARLLRDTNFRIVTNSLLIAQELSARDSGGFLLLGGNWRKESGCFIGPLTHAMLERVNIDIAFVGASGYAVRSGFTCQNSIEAQTKETILARAARKFIVCDSSKCGKRAFSTFAGLTDVDGLIVDDALPEAAHEELSAQGLTIITARGATSARLDA
jgi:DeoR family fructose operon transcriptional repressor